MALILHSCDRKVCVFLDRHNAGSNRVMMGATGTSFRERLTDVYTIDHGPMYEVTTEIQKVSVNVRSKVA